MSKNRFLFGFLGVLVGCVIFMLAVDLLSKPANVSISLKPIECLEIYFFGFVFGMGSIGWVLGGLLLIAFLALFYFLAIRLCKKKLKF